MSFTGDYYAPKKAQSKAKRAFNRAASEKMLIKAGVQFTIRCTRHFVITNGNGHKIDFWPGTGLWIERLTQLRGRGVRELIAHLGG